MGVVSCHLSNLSCLQSAVTHNSFHVCYQLSSLTALFLSAFITHSYHACCQLSSIRAVMCAVTCQPSQLYTCVLSAVLYERSNMYCHLSSFTAVMCAVSCHPSQPPPHAKKVTIQQDGIGQQLSMTAVSNWPVGRTFSQTSPK